MCYPVLPIPGAHQFSSTSRRSEYFFLSDIKVACTTTSIIYFKIKCNQFGVVLFCPWRSTRILRTCFINLSYAISNTEWIYLECFGVHQCTGCISVQVYQCTGISVYKCISVQFYQCTGVSVYRYISVQVYQCTGVSVYRCISVQFYQCTGVSVYRYISVQEYQCTGVSVYRCISVQVYQ